MASIKISKRNNEFYKNIKYSMDEMIIIYDSNIDNAIIFVEVIKQRLNKIIFENPLNFKEFVADYKENEILMEIDHDLYEQYIKACFSIKTMKEILANGAGKMKVIDFAQSVKGLITIYRM